MPAAQQREQLRSEELHEFSIVGPFGGVQSELPLTEIEAYGFADSTNVLFRKGAAYARPGFTALPAFPAPTNEPVLGVFDFFTINGTRVQGVFTTTRLLRWDGAAQSWVNITGPGFTGISTQLFAWDVIGYKLCFTQGADKVWIWDGITASYSQSSANAVAANNLAEIGLHLMVADTIEAGVRFAQRYRWTGSGDPTDWTSFNAGVNDNLNNLGPVNGLIKLGQSGFGFHQKGIVQIIPTGIGIAPFAFVPIVNAEIGDIAPHSLDAFNREGVEQAAFASLDNIYIFNQSSLIPIGDQPIDGRRRLGARSRIYADLLSVDPRTAYGFVTNSINGQIFNAYWLAIPNVSVWVYNFDEGNWTSFTYVKKTMSLGNFFKAGVPRIIDLVGTIANQNWTPATLVNTNPFPGLALGFSDGTVGFVDFTNFSELGWQVVGAKHIFGDRRHKHTIKKFRLTILDQGQATYTVSITNDRNVTETKMATIGNGSGDVISRVVEFNITGLRLQWKVSGPTNSPGAIVEFCPMFDVSGEQRGGTVDG